MVQISTHATKGAATAATDHASLSRAPEQTGAPGATVAVAHDFSRMPILAGPPVLQTKLTVNEPGDQYEREADEAADKVMQMLTPGVIGSAAADIQRACAKCGEEDKRAEMAQTVEGQPEDDMAAGGTLSQTVFRKTAGPTSASDASQPLALNLSGGDPLPAETLRAMSSAFGREFSAVRIHHDAESAESSRRINALAFTHRNHVYFGQGRYDPSSSEGKRLLAHELTHVLQQGYAQQRYAGSLSNGAGKAPRVAAAPGSMIQRQAVWDAKGTVHETNNLANAALGIGPVGFTPPVLNGSILTSLAGGRTAIAKPVLAASSAVSGGVEVTVSSVPTNTGSFDETVLSPGPWTITIPKATVGAKFPSLTACSSAGDTTFHAKGLPNNAAMYQANRRHEDHHAADHKTAFDGSIGSWDAKLTAAVSAKTPFKGKDEPTATAALYTAMGGTPDQVADAYVTEAYRLGAVFHTTPKGGTVKISNPTANKDCSQSSVDGKNPS